MSRKKRTPKFLRALLTKRSQDDFSMNGRVLSREETSLRKEVDYILGRAAVGDRRVVGFGKLVFFSTATRHAWMLDWEDELAICLMKDGVTQAYELGETEQGFAISWQGCYRLEGGLFAYVDDKTPTHLRVIDDLPTDAIRQTIERLRRGV